MNSPRERMLAEGLKEFFFGLQKSKEINKELVNWEQKVLNMDKKEIDRVSKMIASRVEKFAIREENAGKNPSSKIKTKVKEELEKFGRE